MIHLMLSKVNTWKSKELYFLYLGGKNQLSCIKSIVCICCKEEMQFLHGFGVVCSMVAWYTAVSANAWSCVYPVWLCLVWSVCFFTDFNEFLKQDVKVAPPVVVEEKVPEPVQQPKQELKQEPKQLPKVEDEVRWHSFCFTTYKYLHFVECELVFQSWSKWWFISYLVIRLVNLSLRIFIMYF